MEKGEIARYEQFLLFPVFSKELCCTHVKAKACLGKGYDTEDNTDHRSMTTTPFLFKINLFPNNPWFLYVCSTVLLNTLWEKEKLLVTSNFFKLLVTSNFFFCQSVFYASEELFAIFINFKICCLQTLWVWKSLNLLFGKGLTHYHKTPHFDALKIQSCWKHCEKRRNGL